LSVEPKALIHPVGRGAGEGHRSGRRVLLCTLVVTFAGCGWEQSTDPPDGDGHPPPAVSRATPEAPRLVGEPPQSAGTLVTNADGSVSYFYRTGSWDFGGVSEEVYEIVSRDGGGSWSEPVAVVNTGPNTRAQNFLTVSPVSGELIVFYMGKDGRVWRVRTSGGRADDADNRPLNEFRHGGIAYGHCIWVDLPAGGKRSVCGYHGQNSVGAGTYYSDDDWRTWKTSNLVRVPNTIPNIWQTGAVEPTFVQLRDGRIWMLLRNSTERLWESFSEDLGESWGQPRPSRFYAGPNTWSTLKRLSDGSILLVWNHAMMMNPSATQDKWNFTNRDVAHAAISRDEGLTWSGFREIHRDALRDSDQFVNFPGDKGMNESMIAEMPDGQVMVSAGQAPGHRVFLVLDPAWLEEASAADDFSEGLGAWTRQKLLWRPPIYDRAFHHNYNREAGAELTPSPDGTGTPVLHVRRPLDPNVFSQRDGANWNFPAGSTGMVETRIWLAPGFRGGAISLTDRFFQPGDPQGEEMAMVRIDLGADGRIRDGAAPLDPVTSLDPGLWHTLSLRWTDTDSVAGQVELWVDGELVGAIGMLRHSPNGVSYLRFRSMALNNPDSAGFFVASVRAEVE